MTIATNVHALTRPYLTTGPDGKAHQLPALLDQLAAATQPGNTGSGGGSTGQPLPINPAAIDLAREIETQARTEHREATGTNPANIRAAMHTWPTLTPEWCAYLEHVTQDWIDRIEALLHPTKPRRKLNAPCPSCGHTYHGDERATCLTAQCWGPDETMLPQDLWDVRCEHCGAQWEGQNIAWLLTALHQPTQVDLTPVS